VWSFAVVVAEPVGHGSGSVKRCFERSCIDPFAQARLDEAFGLAVGARRVGPCALVANTGFGKHVAEAMALIGRPIVGHHPLDGNAVPRDEGECPSEEGCRACRLLVGQDFGVGEARSIVDSDMKGFPSCAALRALAHAVAGDAVADAVDPAELFRVDVDQFARMFAFVADDGRPDLESRQSVKPAAAQNKSNRRDRPPHLPGYGGPGQALAAQSLDLVFSRRHQPGRARARTRRAIHQAGFAFRPIAIPPFAHRLRIDRNGSRDRGNCPASFKAFDHQHSTTRRGSGILMNVHGAPG